MGVQRLRDEEGAVSGACAALEGRRERALDLLDEDGFDSEIALKQTELSRIRAAIRVVEVARPEPKDLQEVIDRLRSSEPDHAARMHAAALVKEQVRLLLVHPDGMRQTNDETLAWVVENSDAETREAMRFDALKDSLIDPEASLRRFAVMFEGETSVVRGVCPDPSDPTVIRWTWTTGGEDSDHRESSVT